MTHQPQSTSSSVSSVRKLRVCPAKGIAAVAVAILAAVAMTGIASAASRATQQTPIMAGTIAPRSSTSGQSSATGGGTMEAWDWETAADEPGEHVVLEDNIKIWNKEHPKDIISETEMSLPDQLAKLPLALSTPSSAPTITQVNEGYESMGRLVTDDELLPLNSYNNKYGWEKKTGLSPIQLNSFNAKGSELGVGNIYGIPTSGALIGVFYNKKILASVGAKPPTTWAEMVKDFALVKKAGKVAIAYSSGQPTAYRPERVWTVILDHYASPQLTIGIVDHKPGATIDTKAVIESAATFQQWGDDGYFTPGYSGLSDTAGLTQFTTGKAAFFIEGNWYASAIITGLGSNAGFWEPPSTTGGPDEGWSIPKYSNDPSLAVDFINLVLSPQAQAHELKVGDLPLVAPTAKELAGAPLLVQQVVKGWQEVVRNDTLVPFIDWATPDFINQFYANLQSLQAGRMSPSAFAATMESDYVSGGG